ncbi:NAD(P)-dependent alcohol dehydrogenase [Streptomyces sp. Y7]|uniref:NAD(P)-dependent alcohol dehydrogenase n=1 Tax=Streptomyces sp. Y7 TaxID=3342392 RepID=UPI003710E4C9
MSIHVTAAVARADRDDFAVEDLTLQEPRADEVLVRFTAAGLCHTDLEVLAGRLPTPRPVVAGHEGVGVVEAVGSAVTGLAPGDKVVAGLDSCGTCRNCLAGQPAYCPQHGALNFAAQRPDGTVGLTDADGRPVHDHFFNQSSFANWGLAHARGLVRVDADLDDTILAPLGCGVVTGAGAVWNALRVQPGSTVAVFGAGAVGLSAVMAARASGAARIIAVELHAERLTLAAELGATDGIDASSADSVREILSLTSGEGVDHAVECTGRPEVMASAVQALAALGSAAILGVAGLDADVRANAFELLKGRTVIGSVMGHQATGGLIPRILDLYRQGRFPLERLVRTYPLADINTAVADSRAGKTVKAVLTHTH